MAGDKWWPEERRRRSGADSSISPLLSLGGGIDRELRRVTVYLLFHRKDKQLGIYMETLFTLSASGRPDEQLRSHSESHPPHLSLWWSDCGWGAEEVPEWKSQIHSFCFGGD